MEFKAYAWIEARRILDSGNRTEELKRLHKQVKRGIRTQDEVVAIMKAIREEEKR